MLGKQMEKGPEETVREVVMLMFLQAMVGTKFESGVEVYYLHLAVKWLKTAVNDMTVGGHKRIILPLEAGRFPRFDEFLGEMRKTKVLSIHMEGPKEVLTFTDWAPQILEQLLKDLVLMKEDEHEALERLCQSAVKHYQGYPRQD